MKKKVDSEIINAAVSGDRKSLEYLLDSVKDLVFNLSLRMLGKVSDAEDASQEIYIKIITNLSAFRNESKFSTWVYRLSVNHLINYKKSFFYRFNYQIVEFKEDWERFRISKGEYENDYDKEMYAEELKKSCTNTMLQFLKPEQRCIYILGNMFKLKSSLASEILGITPENYRKKLSRIRKKVSDNILNYCGLEGNNNCRCNERVSYAVKNKRLHPHNLEYINLEEIEESYLNKFIKSMEVMEEYSDVFSKLPFYKSKVGSRRFIEGIISSQDMKFITDKYK